MSSNTRSSGSNNIRNIASNSIRTIRSQSSGSSQASPAPTGRQITSYLTTNTFIVVIGFLALVGIGIYFYMQFRDFQRAVKARESGEYTPNQCPDYWTLQDQVKDERGRIVSITCKNDNLLGVCALNPDENTFTFADEIFNNPGSKDMARCKWAKQCKVAWSGYDKLCS